ncbi:peptidyl-prolyl cis-trans isomerase B (cyclophilin B) [Motilibacter rhizosphaerae]|uniref:Peptidyl-prolyl cis-trans isomerase n=1 Tax=Motilibacter rhizosphaerae TaxID=598652 RepID=A0A4Q7NSS7_9ACTN|nr:peptidylprolyl isomerase [Motilibacter rhizosphaerae]RZS89432.1 peptidyl-prolyl cis-trans isomerase B (cyclophilin B) [Motilibacter rhizosphaerae]
MAGSSKRERQLAREKYQRQQARRAAQRARARQRRQVVAAAGSVVAVIALVAVVAFLVKPGGSGKGADAGASPSASASSSAQAAVPVQGCDDETAKPTTKPTYPAPSGSVAAADYTMTMVTDCGTVVATLDGAKAPETVKSFAFLSGKGFFDGTGCHRLTTSGIYVLQCGDPTLKGTGGPGYTIPDENLPTKATGVTYPAGTLAMANTGQPHTGGSQFFIVYKDTSLPASYTVFGKVTDGLDILQRIASAGSDNSNAEGDGKPNQPVVFEKVTVEKAGS